MSSYPHFKKKTLVLSLILAQIATLILISLSLGYLYTHIHNTLKLFSFPQMKKQCTSSRTTKYPPSLSLESFLSFTPIFTSMATKHSFLPHFLGFTYLINLLSCHKLGKMLTNFEFPYMICTCCLIWLEVLAVEYRHIRLLFLLLLY